jgi:hypothetical protein
MDKETKKALKMLENEIRHDKRCQMLREMRMIRVINDKINALMDVVPNVDKQKLTELCIENEKNFIIAREESRRGYEEIKAMTLKSFEEDSSPPAQDETSTNRNSWHG